MAKWMLVDDGGVDRGELGVVEAGDAEEAARNLAELMQKDDDVYNWSADGEEVIQVEGDDTENARVWGVTNVTYAVETEDGTIIGRYDTADEALEAAVNEFKHQCIQIRYPAGTDSPYYDEVMRFNYEHINDVLSCIEDPFYSEHPEDSWIYIRNDANDNGGYITCGGEIYDYAHGTPGNRIPRGDIQQYDDGHVFTDGMEA